MKHKVYDILTYDTLIFHLNRVNIVQLINNAILTRNPIGNNLVKLAPFSLDYLGNRCLQL